MVIRQILIFLAVITFTGEVLAQQQPHPRKPSSASEIPDQQQPHPRKRSPSKAQKAKPVKISADHMVRNSKEDSISAWGHVVVRIEGKTIYADKVYVNNKTSIGRAKGNVIVISPDGTRMKADSTIFDLKSKQGKIYQAKGRIGKNYYFRGKEVHRISDKRFKISRGFLTTCTGKIPDWSIKADKADLIKGDRAFFTGGMFQVRNIPVLYLPVGYIPIDRERKSGFLMPTFGSSNEDGTTFQGSYYWAINQWSDATLTVDYRGKRGVQPTVEYRYTPNNATSGQFTGTYLEDDVTGNEFWKVDMTHTQNLPYGFEFEGKLDLESTTNFNREFDDNPNERTRRNTDSFASITKRWTNNTLDILTRFRDSTETSSDDTFGQLPQILYKTQRTLLGGGPFYFHQDMSFASFLTDLDPSRDTDNNFTVQRFDFHPQVTLPIPVAPWLSITPTVGARETFYSKSLDADQTSRNGFSRELFDFQTVLEGPKINKIFSFKNTDTKFKHTIVPTFTYNYIPDMDQRDRGKINQVFDSVDSVNAQNSLSYNLTQRILKRAQGENGESETKEILRFAASQSYNIREATIDKNPGENRRPFSELRFDLDSQIIDGLVLNADSTYNIYDDTINTLNFEFGIQPVKSLWMIFERRWSRDFSTFITGTFDWEFMRGLRLQLSTRYDEIRDTFLENDYSLVYDNPCRCWGFTADAITRRTLINNEWQDEFKFLFSINLRGLGRFSQGTFARDKLLHREFDY